jgi:hypothetical protein
MKKELEVTNRVAKGGAKADYKKKPFKRTCQNSSGRKSEIQFRKEQKIIRL